MDIKTLTKSDLKEYVTTLRGIFPVEEIEDDISISKIFETWHVEVLVDGGKFVGGAHWAVLRRIHGSPFIGMDHVWVSPQPAEKASYGASPEFPSPPRSAEFPPKSALLSGSWRL